MLRKQVLILIGIILVSTALSLPVPAKDNYAGKIVLYIDSYHEGYEWSDGITKGIRDILKNTGVTLKVHRMDTKRNLGEEFKVQAGLQAKAVIEEFKPDVVIASDDNASKYLVVPYYKNAELPFVFCGLNWDASLYGYPYKNTTGMVEISLTMEIIELLNKYTKGRRVGYLSSDVLTERKNIEYYKKTFNLDFEKIYLAETLQKWQEGFLKLQDEVDMIILENNAGIKDWDNKAAEVFVLKNVKIPSGTTNFWMMPFSLLGLTKIAEEQGVWSAQAALKIINGSTPSEIPIVQNEKGHLFLNIKNAEKLGLAFKPALLKHAEIIK